MEYKIALKKYIRKCKNNEWWTMFECKYELCEKLPQRYFI